MMLFFQSTCTRTTGFNVVDMGALNPGMLVLTAMLMYISTYPSTVIMRTTSVTPIYAQTAIPGTGLLFHTKRLILIDILWVMVPFFIICCIEADNITNDPNFTHFKVIWEVVSAYANVGLSLGYPGVNCSFCGVMHKSSKLILVVVMLFGRHRSFPDKVDQAIQPVFNLASRDFAVRPRREVGDVRRSEGVVTERETTGSDFDWADTVGRCPLYTPV